eukprot:COSAG05_NODE_6979_length_871_cov_1.731865_1_plen_81_part_10
MITGVCAADSRAIVGSTPSWLSSELNGLLLITLRPAACAIGVNAAGMDRAEVTESSDYLHGCFFLAYVHVIQFVYCHSTSA